MAENKHSGVSLALWNHSVRLVVGVGCISTSSYTYSLWNLQPKVNVKWVVFPLLTRVNFHEITTKFNWFNLVVKSSTPRSVDAFTVDNSAILARLPETSKFTPNGKLAKNCKVCTHITISVCAKSVTPPKLKCDGIVAQLGILATIALVRLARIIEQAHDWYSEHSQGIVHNTKANGVQQCFGFTLGCTRIRHIPGFENNGWLYRQRCKGYLNGN